MAKGAFSGFIDFVLTYWWAFIVIVGGSYYLYTTAMPAPQITIIDKCVIADNVRCSNVNVAQSTLMLTIENYEPSPLSRLKVEVAGCGLSKDADGEGTLNINEKKVLYFDDCINQMQNSRYEGAIQASYVMKDIIYSYNGSIVRAVI